MDPQYSMFLPGSFIKQALYPDNPHRLLATLSVTIIVILMLHYYIKLYNIIARCCQAICSPDRSLPFDCVRPPNIGLWTRLLDVRRDRDPYCFFEARQG